MRPAFPAPEPPPAMPRTDVVFAVVQAWPGLPPVETLHATLASATGKVARLLERGEFERRGNSYQWTHRSGWTIAVDPREVLP